ncbi:MAG TPA: hypothetical protein VN729_06470 [Ktedonobacteraceae bacterium]|nr:hypothetical protein [Ktedonobacteraceae bacterium]
MNNPPSPYPNARLPEPTNQAQESATVYGYPHAAGFPQPGYPPTQPINTQAQGGYTNVQQSEYADYAGTQQGGYTLARKGWDFLWIALTALALLLLVAGGSIYYYLQIRSTPGKTLQAYCSAIKSNDGQALYNTYSSAAQAQTGSAHLQQGLRLIEFLSGGIEDCTVDNGSIHENDPQATASITFTLTSGRMSSARLHLIDENGQWKIENNAIVP